MSATAEVIRFYRANEKPYGAFSNLFASEVRYQGRTFPTAEHAYQFGKPRRPKVREWLMAAPSVSLLASAAHALATWDIASDWARVKVPRMRMVLGCKFWQHPELRKLLEGTGSAVLIEAGTVDDAVNRFWGEVNGRGKNMLGVLLMGVRQDLRCGIYCDASMHGLAEGMHDDGTRSPWYAGSGT